MTTLPAHHPDLADLAGGAPDVEARYDLVASTTEEAHLVCCRGDWSVAVCGAVNDAVVVEPTAICPACVEEVERRRPGCFFGPDEVCFEDGSACPSDHAVALRTMRASKP